MRPLRNQTGRPVATEPTNDASLVLMPVRRPSSRPWRRRRRLRHGPGRRRLLVGGQCRHRDSGPPSAGRHPRGTPAAPPCAKRHRHAAGTEGLGATLTPTHRPRAANQTRSRPLSVARPDGRAGGPTREGAAGRRPLHDARPRSLPGRVTLLAGSGVST